MRRFTVINFCKSDKLKFRERKELDNSGFGNGVDVANCNDYFESGSILVRLSFCLYILVNVSLMFFFNIFT